MQVTRFLKGQFHLNCVMELWKNFTKKVGRAALYRLKSLLVVFCLKACLVCWR